MINRIQFLKGYEKDAFHVYSFIMYYKASALTFMKAYGFFSFLEKELHEPIIIITIIVVRDFCLMLVKMKFVCSDSKS